MENEKLYQVALNLVPGIGDINFKHLISYCGSAEAVFKSNKHKLSKIPGIGEKTASSILNMPILSEAEKELKEAQKLNIQILFFTDKQYPSRLKHVYDSPPLLYFKGNCDLNNVKTISIVGTRQATDYGKDVVGEIVSGLKKHNVLIVSGLAYGIDIFAHRQAIKHSLPTVGVMASGMDIIYPSLHRDIAMQMLENGGLLTEFKLGSKPDAHNFPARNRIIAGMSDATIVVEAAVKGGALITADIAFSYNKEVFAVPGNIFNSSSQGCNYLIQSLKANMLLNVKDLELVLGWNDTASGSRSPSKPKYETEEFSVEEKTIVDLLINNNKELTIDEISWKSQINISKIASLLLNLEFKGIIKPQPGKKFKLL
ncbi:MAG: DNA-processing protein DprA [Bacteroidota bacterium]|nr:DNA-processing protein DprA [Bacteroidota bacterium]